MTISLALPKPTHFKYFHSYLIHKQEAQGPHIVNLSTMFFRAARKTQTWKIAYTYLISCQVLLNSVQRRSRKCLSQSEAGTAILFFWSARKKNCIGHWYLAYCQVSSNNTNLVEDVEILLPVKFRWILFSGHRGEVENVSANQRPMRPFFIGPNNTNW